MLSSLRMVRSIILSRVFRNTQLPFKIKNQFFQFEDFFGALNRVKSRSMPAIARIYCICQRQRFGNLGVCFGECRWALLI